MARSDSPSSLPLNADVLDILLVLLEQPQHGYAIGAQLDRRPDAPATDRGNLYRTLRTMVRDGLIEPFGKPTRPQRLAVTPRGRRTARDETQRLERQLRIARRRGLLARG